MRNRQYAPVNSRRFAQWNEYKKKGSNKDSIKMKIDLSDQVVMVTGASRGIGREIARRFADSGARVVVHFHKNSQAAKQTLAD